MQRGFVYILTNPSYKDNIIKIGYDSKVNPGITRIYTAYKSEPFTAVPRVAKQLGAVEE